MEYLAIFAYGILVIILVTSFAVTLHDHIKSELAIAVYLIGCFVVLCSPALHYMSVVGFYP